MIRNPKQEGSNLFDCRPQTGLCSMNCNQCFYNRPGAFYVPIDKPNIPTPEEIGVGIVRMNCGHDSNIQRELVIKTAKQYKHTFFNTSIPKLDFPAPVVFTANRNEEKRASLLVNIPNNLMFVRLRVSSTNLNFIDQAVEWYSRKNVPVVLTFMAYYDYEPKEKEKYVWKQRHINSYWCPTDKFMQEVLKREKTFGGRLVVMCGNIDSYKCKDCRNCETYYWQTVKHIKESI